MPPLRSRPEDIPLLAKKLLEGKLAPGDKIAGANLKKLMSYGWPGNVRELRNVLARAVTLAGKPPVSFDSIVINLGPASQSPATIGAELPGISSTMPYKEAKAQLLQSFDELYVSALLDRFRGNVSKAADAAGLSRKHLYELMRRVEKADSGESTDDDDE